MKEEKIEVVTIGTPDIENLSESEAKAFYAALLARILELRRQQLAEDGQGRQDRECE